MNNLTIDRSVNKCYPCFHGYQSAHHEEENLHALLEKKGSTIHHEAHDDHEHQEKALENLQYLLDAVRTSADRIETGYQFYLAYRKFVGDNLLHLHEEETKLLPELQRLCTDEELRAIEHPTYDLMTAEEMVEMVQLLFPHMNFSDKHAFLTDIKLAQPKKFLHLWAKAIQFLSIVELEKFQDIQKAMESLGYESKGEYGMAFRSYFQKDRPKISIRFKRAQSSQRTLIHSWLAQTHIKEWIHGVGLQNTLNGLENFFQGTSDTTYWIAYDKDTPFAFLITSPEGNDATTLDLFICDLNYLGKGFSAPMIREFLISQFLNVKKVLIDPEATNTRAIHVYQKVGFKIIGEFIASWHPVPHYQMELYMKDLLERQNE